MINIRKILSRNSRLAAISSAVLPWQLAKVGSAPWLNKRVQTSIRDFEAASWIGVYCHKSQAFIWAPC